uniref:DDE_3 domain-containing protein n=1 Tax=Heterorhabditis bacteriophora TaxID=37862 RepID=A0A1I7XHG5_HETBA
MGRASTLSLHERGQIKVLSTAGYTVKQIADVIKRSRKAIMNFLRHQEEYGTKKSSGRPSKLNDREKREILRTASNSTISINESVGLVALMLQKLRCGECWTSCPQLTQRHKDERLHWAKIFMRCDWEKKFNLDCPDGWHSYWRDLRKEPRHFLTRNFGGGSVLVWGAFSRMGLVDLAFVSTKMNSSNYQEVLGHRLVPYVQRFPGVSFTFQQDNATIHASRSTKTWLQDNSVDTVDWPSRSPDLNPIENLWAILVRRIYADNRQFETVKDLQNAISKAWNEIDEDVIKNLVNMGIKQMEVAKGTVSRLGTVFLYKVMLVELNMRSLGQTSQGQAPAYIDSFITKSGITQLISMYIVFLILLLIKEGSTASFVGGIPVPGRAVPILRLFENYGASCKSNTKKDFGMDQLAEIMQSLNAEEVAQKVYNSLFFSMGDVQIEKLMGRWYTTDFTATFTAMQYSLDREQVVMYQGFGRMIGPDPGEILLSTGHPADLCPYFPVKMGGLNHRGEYEYMILSQPLKYPTIVLARDLSKFEEKYRKDVYNFVEKHGFLSPVAALNTRLSFTNATQCHQLNSYFDDINI